MCSMIYKVNKTDYATVVESVLHAKPFEDFPCADYYKHHRCMASMKQVACLIADAIDKARKQACLFQKNA